MFNEVLGEGVFTDAWDLVQTFLHIKTINGVSLRSHVYFRCFLLQASVSAGRCWDAAAGSRRYLIPPQRQQPQPVLLNQHNYDMIFAPNTTLVCIFLFYMGTVGVL